MFVPLNRHILVKREENEEPVNDRSFVLPDDYAKPKETYEVVEVRAVATDCKMIVNVGDHIVVERSMVNTVTVGGSEYYLVLENYVYGAMTNED
jgi:co-chaperonin GroES (HSP10)